MDVVRGDLVAQHAARLRIERLRYRQPARERAPSIENHQRRRGAFAPGQAANLDVRNEAAVGPDAVFIQAAPDALAQRHRIDVIDQHHRLAEHELRVQPQHGDLVEDYDGEDGADPHEQAVERRPRRGPRHQRLLLQPPVSQELIDQVQIEDEKAGAENVEEPREKSRRELNPHTLIRVYPSLRTPTAPAADRSSAGSAPRRSPARRRARARCSPRDAAYGWRARRRPCRWPVSW